MVMRHLPGPRWGMLKRILKYLEMCRKVYHWVWWWYRLHRGVKLLEGEVRRGTMREGSRRWEEIGQVLGCGKMRKMFWNWRWSVGRRHLCLNCSGVDTPVVALTSLCHLRHRCSLEALLLLTLYHFACLLNCLRSLSSHCSSQVFCKYALHFVVQCLPASP